MQESGIYKITNIINNKCYVGSAKNIKSRWRDHISDLIKNKHHSILLQRAWNKYFQENFNFEIVERCEKSNLVNREQYYFDLLKPEYNISKTAGSPLGIKHTEVAKRNMSLAHLGKKKGPHSEETKRKLSLAQKGIKKTKEHAENIKKAVQGKNNPFYGKHHSEETKKIISKRTSEAMKLMTRGNNVKSKLR